MCTTPQYIDIIFLNPYILWFSIDKFRKLCFNVYDKLLNESVWNATNPNGFVAFFFSREEAR